MELKTEITEMEAPVLELGPEESGIEPEGGKVVGKAVALAQ